MTCTRCQWPITEGQKYYRTKRGAHHEECPKPEHAFPRGLTMPITLEDYLAGCLNRAAPVIDHLLRAERLPDGRIKFYIHPASADGDTPDFVVSGNTLLRWPE